MLTSSPFRKIILNKTWHQTTFWQSPKSPKKTGAHPLDGAPNHVQLAEDPAMIHSTIVLIQEPGTRPDLLDPDTRAVGTCSKRPSAVRSNGETLPPCLEEFPSTTERRCGATSSPPILTAHLVSVSWSNAKVQVWFGQWSSRFWTNGAQGTLALNSRPPCTNKFSSAANAVYFFKNTTLMRRSTILSLTLQFVFPG
jgi:hypothetical protein